MNAIEELEQFKADTNGMTDAALAKFAWANKHVVARLSRVLLRRVVGSCRSCVTEAAKQLRLVDKNKAIAINTCKYELKAGAILRDFERPEMTCTRVTLTDEKAEYFLRKDPSLARFFAVGATEFLASLKPTEEVKDEAEAEVKDEAEAETEAKAEEAKPKSKKKKK